jgi:hypothetical protein
VAVPLLPVTASTLKTTALERLRRLGAITVRPSVFVLPESPIAREEIGWLKAEIERGGGELTAFAADTVDAWTDERLIEEFRKATDAAYETLARDVARSLETADPLRPARRAGAKKLLGRFEARLAEIERLDFFGASSRETVRARLAELRGRLLPSDRPAASRSTGDASYRGRLWVTGPRPGADGMASAWLIQRFVDPQATFAFAPHARDVAAEAVPFDMFGVELSHRGDDCTFEALRDRFSVRDAGVDRLARLVHELDLHDGRYEDAAAETLSRLIGGLQLAEPDDATLLRHGMALFEALYRSPALLARS